MTFIELACGACAAFALTYIFAVMTWRRTLARRSLVLGLSTLVFLLVLLGSRSLWLAGFAASMCIAAISLLLIEEVRRARQRRQHRPRVAA